MFDVSEFTKSCRNAIASGDGAKAICDLTRDAFTDPTELLSALGKPTKGGIFPLYQSETLTILNIVWPVGMTLAPHNHNAWAVIGIYTGCEENTFWTRVENDPDGRLEQAGTRTLNVGDVQPLGEPVIHSVTNPGPGLTGAIHIYGADFFAIDRSLWDAGGCVESPYDMSVVKSNFSD
jgi:predicted metal-dependent enzyme (double-stranded beta helix superfamily)